MGCGASSEAGGNGESQARRVADRPVEIVWEKDDRWEEMNDLFRQKDAAAGQEGEEAGRDSQRPEAFLPVIRGWLDKRYRDCARTGTIKEMDIRAGFPPSKSYTLCLICSHLTRASSNGFWSIFSPFMVNISRTI